VVQPYSFQKTWTDGTANNRDISFNIQTTGGTIFPEYIYSLGHFYPKLSAKLNLGNNIHQ
jgi:hypothetical protein